MLTNIDQGDLRGHGHRKDFFKEGALGDFSKIFLGDAKSGKINFSRGCQKWQNLRFLIRNYENNLFC